MSPGIRLSSGKGRSLLLRLTWGPVDSLGRTGAVTRSGPENVLREGFCFGRLIFIFIDCAKDSRQEQKKKKKKKKQKKMEFPWSRHSV